MKKYIIWFNHNINLRTGSLQQRQGRGQNKQHLLSTEEVGALWPFDNWILGNYTHPYNIALKYRMEDSERHDKLLPTIKIRSTGQRIIKHVWLEITMKRPVIPDFLRPSHPQDHSTIGSPAYEEKTEMAPWYWERQKVL